MYSTTVRSSTGTCTTYLYVKYYVPLGMEYYYVVLTVAHVCATNYIVVESLLSTTMLRLLRSELLSLLRSELQISEANCRFAPLEVVDFHYS